MSEQVLTKEVIKLRREYVAERRKKMAVQKNGNNELTATSADSTEEPITNSPEQLQDTTRKEMGVLEQNYYNLIQLLVRYGEQPVEINEVVYPVGDIIIYTLENDNIAPPKPVYQKIIDEFKLHSKEPDFKAEKFFTLHDDLEISAMAIEMVAEKYQLSTQYEEGEEKIQLNNLVMQLLCEIKLTVINGQIEEVMNKLKEAQKSDDWNAQRGLLLKQQELWKRKSEICEFLGNRIITN